MTSHRRWSDVIFTPNARRAWSSRETSSDFVRLLTDDYRQVMHVVRLCTCVRTCILMYIRACVKWRQTALFFQYKSRLNSQTASKWRRTEVDATSLRRIDVNTMSFQPYMPSGKFSHDYFNSSHQPGISSQKDNKTLRNTCWPLNSNKPHFGSPDVVVGGILAEMETCDNLKSLIVKFDLIIVIYSKMLYVRTCAVYGLLQCDSSTQMASWRLQARAVINYLCFLCSTEDRIYSGQKKLGIIIPRSKWNVRAELIFVHAPRLFYCPKRRIGYVRCSLTGNKNYPAIAKLTNTM